MCAVNELLCACDVGYQPPLPGYSSFPRWLFWPHSLLPLCVAVCSPPCRNQCNRLHEDTVSTESSYRCRFPPPQSRCCYPCTADGYKIQSKHKHTVLPNMLMRLCVDTKQNLMMFSSSWRTANMGRYCLCSTSVFFLAKSLLASLFSFMWSANFCSVLRWLKCIVSKPERKSTFTHLADNVIQSNLQLHTR